MTYVDGFVSVARADNKQAYLDLAARAAPVFREHGATRVMECWQDDVPHGTDFYRAVEATEGEAVLFSWIEWPSKDVRDAGMAKVMADPRMAPADGEEMPFDMQRIIFGGFATILDA